MEAGIAIFIAFWLLWLKLNIITRLKLLNHYLLIDLAFTVFVFALYGGSAAGLEAATMACVIVGLNLIVARRLFGYYHMYQGKWYYHVGYLNQTNKIIEHKRKLYVRNHKAT